MRGRPATRCGNAGEMLGIQPDELRGQNIVRQKYGIAWQHQRRGGSRMLSRTPGSLRCFRLGAGARSNMSEGARAGTESLGVTLRPKMETDPPSEIWAKAAAVR